MLEALALKLSVSGQSITWIHGWCMDPSGLGLRGRMDLLVESLWLGSWSTFRVSGLRGLGVFGC